MEQLPRLSLLLVVAVLGFIDSGYSFLYRREEDNDSPDKFLDLESRYWNEDARLCVERFCLPHVHSDKMFLSCIRQNCVSGLTSATYRDTTDVTLAPLNQFLRQTELCTDSFIESIPEADLACGPGKCPIEEPLDADRSSEKAMRAFQYGVYNLCRKTVCGQEQGNDHRRCIKERCCGGHQGSAGIESGMSKRAVLRGPIITSKRRPDDLAQCMQSYCSGLSQAMRLSCIYMNCDRQ